MATFVNGAMNAALLVEAVDDGVLDGVDVDVELLLLELPQPASTSIAIARTRTDGLLAGTGLKDPPASHSFPDDSPCMACGLRERRV